nr:MAG TPA: hypothetical protein [Caudoviricetes sp.]
MSFHNHTEFIKSEFIDLYNVVFKNSCLRR